MDIKGRWALITGASAGIGRDFAREFASRGTNCVLVARRADRLEEVADDLRANYGVEVEVEVVDLTAADAPEALFDRLRARGRSIEILVNNAGFGLHGDFVRSDLEQLTAMLQLNVVVVTQLTRLFAGAMNEGEAASTGGYVMNIASIAALNALPNYAAYAATKSFVVSLSDAISIELASTKIHVIAVLPGVTWTEFFDVSGQKPNLYSRLVGMKSADVAREGVNAMLKGKSRVITGWRNKISMALAALLPHRFTSWMTGLLMRNG